MMIFVYIILALVVLFILYIVIFAAVKDGIDRSEVGQLIREKYGSKKEVVAVSNEEIERELEELTK